MWNTILNWLLIKGVADYLKNLFSQLHQRYVARRVIQTEKENDLLKLEVKKLENKDEIDKRYSNSNDSVVIKSITKPRRR